ncbi:Helix-turN-helix, arac domain protein [Flavobacterium anhuiense]|uniref:Helix-turN-helix, arac domain protein n=1 Tax=Flavobacterium anhuiense TaxID=459526 RepID=A0A444VUR3_9FLAO|nr:helix-turn-helix domain-containing protein [Flavobacterium anhuiense]RYJ37369.1 Helix-turN-helix, arac domain protein [Flavobacterium anhuiense]
MEYKKIKPCKELEPYIHFFWELKGNLYKSQQERVYPDGCSGIIINLGNSCLTDNGSLFLEFGKTYAVGAMDSYKDSLIDMDTHLAGACLKPAAFANFYSYDPQRILINNTVEFEKSNSFHTDTVFEKSFDYFNRFYLDRLKNKNIPLQSVINDIDLANGQISIYELAKKNCTTVRQLERNFKKYIGLSPKEYSNIIRFQNALNIIKKTNQDRSLSDIAFECGYYDHSHLSNEIKRNTGLSPSSL